MHTTTVRPSNAPGTTSLEPRFRPPLTLADILDEGISLYRKHIVAFALTSAIPVLPGSLAWLPLYWSLQGLSGITSPGLAIGNASALLQVVNFAVLGAVVAILTALLHTLWIGAIVAATDSAMRGRRPEPLAANGLALRSAPALLMGMILFLLFGAVLLVMSMILMALTLFVLGVLAAFIGALVWWLRPRARRPWLKWLIVLTTPYGVVIYAALRGSLLFATSVLERRGPVDALLRSTQLTAGHWFRIATVLTVAPVLVGVLVWIVQLLISIPLSIGSTLPGALDPGFTNALMVINLAVTTVLQIIFGSAPIVIYTVLFHDLRNTQDGTDLIDRLRSVELSTAAHL